MANIRLEGKDYSNRIGNIVKKVIIIYAIGMIEKKLFSASYFNTDPYSELRKFLGTDVDLGLNVVESTVARMQQQKVNPPSIPRDPEYKSILAAEVAKSLPDDLALRNKPGRIVVPQLVNIFKL